jgi:hypothetical protein
VNLADHVALQLVGLLDLERSVPDRLDASATVMDAEPPPTP